MKKLLVKISVVLVLLAACDMLAGLGLDWLRDHSPDGRYYKTKYSLEACNEDVVVIGSSRGEINYVSQIIEDSLGLPCWNASRGGQGTPYFRAIQEGILSRYAPKVVILNIDDNDLETRPNYEHAGVLRPFYHSRPEIRPILDQGTRIRVGAAEIPVVCLQFELLLPDSSLPGKRAGWKNQRQRLETAP